MEKPVLLIADSNEDFRVELKKALLPMYQVLCCQDGQTALDMLRERSIDVLVMDPLLPEMDGLSVLQLAAEEDIHPVTLLVGSYFSAYIEETAARLGVGYLLRKPCNLRMLVQRIQDVVRRANIQGPDQRKEIQRVLLEMGFSAKRKGFQYLTEAIEYVLEYGFQPLTKVVYPEVGKQFGHSWENVERALRTAVEHAWEERDPEVWNRILLSDLRDCPSNGEFVKRIVLHFQQNRGGYDLQK